MKENKKVKKTRKHAFDEEGDHEKKNKKERKHALDQESDQERKKTFFLFFLLSCFLL